MKSDLLKFFTWVVLGFIVSINATAVAGSYGFPSKAEDAAHSSGDSGVPVWGVNRITGESTFNTTDGDYTPISVDSSGFTQVAPQPTKKKTYIGCTGFFTPAASATDLWEMKGSSSTTVKILKIFVSYTCTTTANTNNFFLKVLRSATAGSGGTSSATTFYALDSNNAAVTATAKHYTANPTAATGTGGFIFGHASAGNSTANTAGAGHPAPIVLYDSTLFGEPITLRGTSELLLVHNNGVSFGNTSNSICITVVFTEE